LHATCISGIQRPSVLFGSSATVIYWERRPTPAAIEPAKRPWHNTMNQSIGRWRLVNNVQSIVMASQRY